MKIDFEWLHWGEPGVADALALRKAVFVDEQGFSLEADRDALDRTARHVLGRGEAGEPLCTARMFEERPGVWHAGRIAVRGDLRGQGVGRQLICALADEARAQGGQALELGAQFDKQGFYSAVGFSVCGPQYLDEGYPHVPMRMEL